MDYQKIIDKGADTEIIRLNMSENFFALNQSDKALEYAQKALEMSPNNNVVRETYAIRLVNAPQGVYLLQYTSPRGTITKRLIVQ